MLWTCETDPKLYTVSLEWGLEAERQLGIHVTRPVWVVGNFTFGIHIYLHSGNFSVSNYVFKP